MTTRVIDYGGSFWDDVRPGQEFLAPNIAASGHRIREIGDNAGCMTLKGASPDDVSDERAERRGLDERFDAIAQCPEIEPPARDLKQVAE